MERDYQPQRYSREGRKEPHAMMERERDWEEPHAVMERLRRATCSDGETGKSHMQ